eukprot:CAMPEP_0116872974 /NCGR_PEP_ID=MMETSP0463-20121206/3925_1 /TAXON_ID=181622 /ORGANISM="Strombidinopsis sp, Strain SopsisLIS2011" /LENGTH=97 /DNA_ID=CAMNT_0004514133 /DNA_START=819 /DNA_END=1112 /DNA_ORIENTATION=+
MSLRLSGVGKDRFPKKDKHDDLAKQKDLTNKFLQSGNPWSTIKHVPSVTEAAEHSSDNEDEDVFPFKVPVHKFLKSSTKMKHIAIKTPGEFEDHDKL